MSKGLFFERWPVVYFFLGWGGWGVGGRVQGADSFALVAREVHAFLQCSF